MPQLLKDVVPDGLVDGERIRHCFSRNLNSNAIMPIISSPNAYEYAANRYWQSEKVGKVYLLTWGLLVHKSTGSHQQMISMLPGFRSLVLISTLSSKLPEH